MKRENHQFAMIANVAMFGNVNSAVKNASRITENVLIPIVIRWGIFRRNRMDEFLQALAKIIEQYGGVVLTLGIVTFVITLILVLLIFAIVMKSLWDEDRKWKK